MSFFSPKFALSSIALSIDKNQLQFLFTIPLCLKLQRFIQSLDLLLVQSRSIYNLTSLSFYLKQMKKDMIHLYSYFMIWLKIHVKLIYFYYFFYMISMNKVQTPPFF